MKRRFRSARSFCHVGALVILLTSSISQAQRHATSLGEGPWLYKTDDAQFRVVAITRDLEYPWGMAFLPDGNILITERPGRLRIVRDGKLDPKPIAGVPTVYAVRLDGLLDIALHPQFRAEWTRLPGIF